LEQLNIIFKKSKAHIVNSSNGVTVIPSSRCSFCMTAA
jgi:hypothetical protein